MPTEQQQAAIAAIMGNARMRGLYMGLRIPNTQRLVNRIRGTLQPERGQKDPWLEAVKVESINMATLAVKRAKRELLPDAAKERLKPLKGLDHPLMAADEWPHKVAMGIALWAIEEDKHLAAMEEAARYLSVAEWCDEPERNGFSLTGLAVIVGHAGDLSAYPSADQEGNPRRARIGKGALWRRLGLAPYERDGLTFAGSAWRWFGGLSSDDWMELGYNGRRLGDIYGKVTQPLIRAQWRGPNGKAVKKGKAEPGPIGPYGEAYIQYKTRQQALNEQHAFVAEVEWQLAWYRKKGNKPPAALAEGRLTPANIEKRALRYMTKRLVRDLWQAWRRADLVMSERTTERLPADEHRDERETRGYLPHNSEASHRVPPAHPTAA
jgi:hypothetical protein